MTAIKTTLMLVFLLLTIGSALQIFSVSVQSDSVSSNAIGSSMGGTKLYINGIGFQDHHESLYTITVGGYPCALDDGTTSSTLTCLTSSVGLADRYNQEVKVQIAGFGVVYSATVQTFSYLTSQTPYLYAINPAVNYAGKQMFWYGVHRILDVGDGELNHGHIYSLLLGDDQCNITGVTQNQITANSLNVINSMTPKVQKAGFYNVKEHNVAGYSYSYSQMTKTPLGASKEFDFVVMPAITSTTGSGSIKGNTVTVQGTGFSPNKSEISVTVDDVPCQVTQSSTQEITCDLEAKVAQNTQMVSNAATPADNFQSGSGFFYQRFDISQVSGKTVANLKNLIDTGDLSSLTLQEQAIRGQVKSINVYGSNYLQVWKGYFVASATGSHTFRGVGDDRFSVYITNETHNSTVVFGSSDYLLNVEDYMSANIFPNYYESDRGQAGEKSLELVAYNRYYMEIYHINYSGGEWFELGIEIPNTDASIEKYQSYEVQKLTTSLTSDPEILKFNVSNAGGGTITYQYLVRNADFSVKYNHTATTIYNASDSQFCAALGNLQPFKGTTRSCVRQPLIDNDNMAVSDADSSRALRFQYTVTVSSFRSAGTVSTDNNIKVWVQSQNTSKATISRTQVRPHSDLISGTFTIDMGGININLYDSTTKAYTNPNIPYDISNSDLQTAFRQLNGFGQVNVRRNEVSNNAAYGATWIIYFTGYNGDIPDLVLNSAGLLGGGAGTPSTVTAMTRRQFSTNLLVEPMDFRFMSTHASAPSVRVTVNGVPSVCLADCSYTFINDSPQVNDSSLAGNTLTIELDRITGSTNTLSDLTVTLDGQACTNLAGTLATFTCDLPTNSDGSPIIRAGEHYPVVKIKDVGVLEVIPAVLPITQDLTIASVTPSSGPGNGGYEATILASGLPSKVEEAEFTICNKRATLKSINNIEATISIPDCDTIAADTLTVSYNSRTDNTPFTFTAATTALQVTGINPTSASPVLKDVMTITGSGFGTDPNVLSVHLTNATGNIYVMRVLETTDTQIKVGISGGLPGNFDVTVAKVGQGYAVPTPATANDFVYEVVVDSLTPTTGSIYGGTLITLSGKNFIEDGKIDSMVTIGNQLNQLCRIESMTQSEIKCRTPAKHQDESDSTPYIVLVNNKLRIDSTCSGTCDFSYITADNSPLVTNVSSSWMTTGGITLTGQRFDVGSTCEAVLFNRVTQQETVLTPTSCNATHIVAAVPAVESGYYYVKARIDDIGESNVMELTVGLDINAALPSELSVLGGQVTIQGSGFPATWPATHYNELSLIADGKSVKMDIASTSASAMVFNIPKGYNNKAFRLSIKSPSGTSKNITFSQKTTATPTVTLTTPSASIVPGVVAVTLDRTVLSSVQPETVQVYSVTNPNSKQTITSPTFSGTTITFSVTLKSGQYGFKLYDSLYGWYTSTGFINVSQTGTYTVTDFTTSFNGGQVTVTGADISQGATVTVNGQVGTFISSTATQALFNVPKLITPTTYTAFKLAENTTIDLSSKLTWGESENWEYIFDKDHSTSYNSTSAECYIGVDIGENTGIYLTRIRYFPYPKWAIASDYIQGGKFQASNDNSTWVDIATIDSTVHSGWNTFMIQNQNVYRYVRFVHTSESGCQLAEFELSGVQMSQATVADTTSHKSDLIFKDGVTTQTLTQVVEYRADNTARVTAINPVRGDVFGGYDITLTGEYLDLGTQTVFIDGVECVYVSHTATQIVCTVGSRTQIPDELSFKVQVGTTTAITEVYFDYVLRWSDIRTWGTDPFPIADDMVYVPKNMRLLVDESTPVLKAIVVNDGILEFADESDMVIQAEIITLRGGKFIAGTKEKPYQHNLKFIMHGNYWLQQQPIFGNKGIGCYECDFSMQGKVRQPTWTTVAATISPGDSSFTVSEDVDWIAGEVIVVASTSYDHNEAEQKVISTVVGRTITVQTPFKYQHYSDVEAYDTDNLEMRAEVALLTRNIQMMGDDDSVAQDYGSHLLLAGSAQKGLVGKIAYVEFSKCGQPQIPGRYCHHFHMNGDVPESYSIGNSVHHSMARILTIHGVHFLYVAWNVGYQVKGHNFFIEDGIETNNVLEYNLAISSLTVNNMMQTDISVASFWVTNPYNHIRFNRAAGGDFYGFWYEVKQHPDGPSATSDICPQGFPLGESHDNVAHSYVRFGLRIFRLSSRKHPCAAPRNNALADPWSENPSIESRFYNYVLYKNGQSGLLAEETGHTVFENFVIAESALAGMEFYRNNLTREDVKAINIIIIGKSTGNAQTVNTDVYKGKGVILPRSGTLDLDDIRFYSFASTQIVWQACSKCDSSKLYTNMGAIYKAKNIKYGTNINGSYYDMLGMRRQIFYDQDGTLLGTQYNGTSRPSGVLVYAFPHLSENAACHIPTSTGDWDNTVVCDNTVQIQQIAFTNIQNKNEFRSMPIKIKQIADVSVVVDEAETVLTKQYSLFGNMEPKEQKETYSFPFIAGSTYNVWWASGLDWTHLAINVNYPYIQSGPAVIFKFNYTENRELFEIGPQNGNSRLNKADYITADVVPMDVNTCTNGQYFHDNSDDMRVLHVCASSKNKEEFQYVSLNAIYCRYLCPAPPGTFIKEDFVRKWSNTTQWPNGVLPADGDNVSINGNWTIIMDVNPPIMDYFEIEGDVIIEDTQDFLIQADHIWLKYGSIKAGSASQPFDEHSITFQLNGNKSDPSFTIDPQMTGNKQFVITGKLELYGKAPATQWTKLKAFANAGDTTISVLSASGWAQGDQIVIAPSFSSRTEFEKVTITDVSGTTVTFTPALQYNHFGAGSATIQKSYGTLDTRAGVGHLTRNIKFTAGADAGWGYSVVQYAYANPDQPTIITTGNIKLSGVEFKNGGKYDTENAALQIKDIRVDTEKTLIEKSSFHDCQDLCVNVENVYDVTFSKNVFYNGRKFHAQVLDAFNFNFNNNLMIGAVKRPSTVFSDLIACLNMYQAFDVNSRLVSVTNNLCQGSQGHGFVIPTVPCADIDSYPFADNIAGSCQVAFILNKASSTCIASKGLIAYASQIGQIINPAVSELRFSNFIMADNQRALSLRVGGGSKKKTLWLNDSYIAAISRPDCAECYGPSATVCTNNRGIRMMAIGSNSESLPGKFGPGFDVICREQTINGKAFSHNMEFAQYRDTYTNPNLTQCSGNKLFFPHTTSDDITGSHHFWNTSCIECEQRALADFIPPSPSKLGWFGGCGQILCTGMNNYMIFDYDTDGDFLPAQGVLIANNSWIGQGEPSCTFNAGANGYFCSDLDFAVLEYESIAPDFNTRIMWPVYLKYDGGNWESVTNAWIEWEWQGGQPLNLRKARFVSILKLHKTYNMTFTSMPPEDMVFEFQRRLPTGNSSDWAIIKMHYPKPNSIRVQANGVTVKPISLLDNNGQTPIDETVCGSNKFFYKNYTIHFAVHAGANCRVRVSLVNSIQLTARFAMPITEFFANDGATTFINRMSALLGITDTSRIKIVGVYEGSVQIVTHITQENISEDSSTTANATARKEKAKATKAKLDSIIAEGTLAQEMASVGFGALQSVQASTILLEEQETPESDQTGLIVGITVGTFLIICVMLISVVCYMRKRAKIGSLGVGENLKFESDDDMKKVSDGHTLENENESGLRPISEENYSVVDLAAQKKELY